VRLLAPPEKEWGSRVRAEPLANYVKALLAELEARVPAKLKAGLRVTVGVKQGRRSRAWVEDAGGKPFAELEKALGKVPPPSIRNGPIAFQLDVSVRGGEVPSGTSVPRGGRRW